MIQQDMKLLMNIKMNNLFKSVLFASFITMIFRIIMIQYPLYNSRAKIHIKKNIHIQLSQIDCVGISTKASQDSSGKEFIFTSKSYSKKYKLNIPSLIFLLKNLF